MTTIENRDEAAERPEYYAERGVSDPTEQRMRADYARFNALAWTAANVWDDRNFVELLDRAHEVRDRWTGHESKAVREDWRYLDDAYHEWKEEPELASLRYAREGHTLTDVQRRSQEQARELHGYSADTRFVYPNPSVDSATYVASGQAAPRFGAVSKARTAQLASTNAFAGLSTNAFAAGPERQGMSR